MHFQRNVVFWIGALIIFVAFLWLLSPILLPFVFGLVIAYAFEPLNRRLTKYGISRNLASFAILAGLTLAIVALLLFIIPELINQLSGFIATRRPTRNVCKALSATRIIRGSNGLSATISTRAPLAT
jgi:predicted PurR-regulated permease PerM